MQGQTVWAGSLLAMAFLFCRARERRSWFPATCSHGRIGGFPFQVPAIGRIFYFRRNSAAALLSPPLRTSNITLPPSAGIRLLIFITPSMGQTGSKAQGQIHSTTHAD